MLVESGGAGGGAPGDGEAGGGGGGAEAGRRTEYEQMVWNMQHDPRWLQEAGLGKRVGFYRFLENIGSGNFSHVKKAMHQLTRDRVAVKIIDKTKLDAKTRKMIDQEIKTMEAVHHPNIIRLFEVMDTYRKLYLVMEYAPGGELYTRVSVRGPCGEDEARTLFLQVAQAVLHMHKLGYVHRDIKAENVFYYNSRNTVKLGDFGFSARLPDDPTQKLNTFCGSPPYAAPELFRDERYAGPPVDVWALGVLLFFLLTAGTPFRAPTLHQLKACILDGTYRVPPNLSAPCRHMIENTLVQNVAERLSVHEIVEHEWFRARAPAASRARKHSLASLARRLRRQRAPSGGECAAPSEPRDLELNGVPEAARGDYSREEGEAGAPWKGRSFDAASLPSECGARVLRGADGSRAELGRHVMFPSPTERLADVGPLERRARQALQRRGVTARMLLEAAAGGARSPLLGAYRSTVSMILNEQYLWEAARDLPPHPHPHHPRHPHLVAVTSKGGGKECFRAKLAKACVIL